MYEHIHMHINGDCIAAFYFVFLKIKYLFVASSFSPISNAIVRFLIGGECVSFTSKNELSKVI